MTIKVVRSENTKAFIKAINGAARKYGIIFRSLEGRLVDLDTGSSEFVYLTRKLKTNDPVQTGAPTSRASIRKAKPQAKIISFKDRQRVNKFYWKDGTITDTRFVLGYSDGHKVLHRVDGPAIELTNGKKVWFIDGEELTEERFNQLVKEIKALPLATRLADPREWVRIIA